MRRKNAAGKADHFGDALSVDVLYLRGLQSVMPEREMLGLVKMLGGCDEYRQADSPDVARQLRWLSVEDGASGPGARAASAN
jgi:hypothetical protein